MRAAVPLMLASKNWSQLHEGLARIGVQYERKGSGGVLRVGGSAVKASLAHRAASLGALEKKLGAFVGAGRQPERLKSQHREHVPLAAAPPLWRAYMDARTAHYNEKNAALVELRKRHDVEREAGRNAQRKRREELLAEVANKAMRQALRSVLAAETAAAKAEAIERFKREREDFRKKHPRFPDFEQWLRERDPVEAERWRYRASAPGRIEGEDFVAAKPRDIRAFTSTIQGPLVLYHRTQENVEGPVSFVDQGRAIHVYDTQDRATVLGSLQLAAEKWGRFRVAGHDGYLALCTELAVEHGFQLDNPELQGALTRRRAGARAAASTAATPLMRLDAPARPAVEKVGSRPPPDCRGGLRSIADDFYGVIPMAETRRVRGEVVARDASSSELRIGAADLPKVPPNAVAKARSGVSSTKGLRAFEAYHAAVGADRYRVTAINMARGGERKAFILDKSNGVSLGFSPEEISRRAEEMRRLEQRGENLYYTPLSAAKHHILVDDLNRERLSRLVVDGFRPAVVIESSPNNYQAIINVPKLGSAYDREIANRVSQQLNREYGDPQLSGAVHPHRAPGYENRKPKHVRPDGTYPEVTVLKAEPRDCSHTLELTRKAMVEVEGAVKCRLELSRGMGSLASPQSTISAEGAYYAHYQDVMKRFGGEEVNYSRVDSMIALRLRATGHGAAAVAATLERCAPSIRPPEAQGSHSWGDYSRRTVEYAFGMGGDQQLEKTQRYHEQWKRLENKPMGNPLPRMSLEVPDL